MTGILRKTSHETTNISRCKNSKENSNFCTVGIKNVYLNQTHYLNDINIFSQFHNLLITYCRSHRMDLKNFAFIVPSDDLSTPNISWKVATPSMLIKDAILESLFDITERKVYIQCVLKKDVSKYVTWNNCDSTKYTKVSSDAVRDVIHLPEPIRRRKRRAPPPPPIPTRRHLSRTTSKASQLTCQDSPSNTDSLYQAITNSTSDMSQMNSTWSLNDNQELSGALSTITIHAMEEYREESSTSEPFFIPKPFVEPEKEDRDANSLSTECRITPESSSTMSINGKIQRKVDFDSFKEKPYEGTNYRGEIEPEMVQTKRIPTLGSATSKQIENVGISSLLKTSPSTFAPIHVPNFDTESLKTRSSSREGSTAGVADDTLQQAKTALRTVHQQKITSVPLRKASVEHRPNSFTNSDRTREKDWNGRFWCVDNRSRVLSFMVSDMRQF